MKGEECTLHDENEKLPEMPKDQWEAKRIKSDPYEKPTQQNKGIKELSKDIG